MLAWFSADLFGTGVPVVIVRVPCCSTDSCAAEARAAAGPVGGLDAQNFRRHEPQNQRGKPRNTDMQAVG